MNIFVPLCSLGRQFALPLCDWSETGVAYSTVTAEELDTCVEDYTRSFVTGVCSPAERMILECPAFQLALTSEEVGRYAAELGGCTEEKKFHAIMARILLCCCMELPHDMGDSYAIVLHCLNRYSSGLIRKLAKTFQRDFLKTSRTFLLEKFPATNLVESNALYYASRYKESLCWEKYTIHDSATASLKDCYVSPTYELAGYLVFESVPLEGLLESFLSGTVSPALADPLLSDLVQRSTALIRGPHGAGKTSILYKLAYDILHGRYETDRCFLGIELKSLADTAVLEPNKLLGAVLEYLNCGIDELENSILCLDGIDDLLLLLGKESLVDTYIRCLAEDIAKIPGCKCVVTSSSGNLCGRRNDKFWVAELRTLSDKSRDELVQKYATVHPTVNERLQSRSVNALPQWPDQLYTALALDLPLREQVDYWSARIQKVEQLWQRRESTGNTAQLGSMAETLAVTMMEQQQQAIRNPELAYPVQEKRDALFLQEAYGLTLLEVGVQFAVRFHASDTIYYLAARKIEKEAAAHLQIGTEDFPNLKSWCGLFSKCPLSPKFLSYYRNFFLDSGAQSDAPFTMMNATLSQNKLVALLPDNTVGMEYYLKNLPILYHAYQDINCHTSLDVSEFLRWLRIAQNLGAQMDNFTLLDMDFLDDIQHFSFAELKIVDCAFVNCKISFCQLRKVIRNTLFSNTVFRNCNLSKVDFLNCRFLHCRFEHCDFTEADLSNSAMKNTVFADCDFNHADVKDLRLSGCTFENSKLRLCAFRHIDCCAFKQTDISAAKFSGLDLRNTELEDLYMSGVYGANFWRNTASPALCFKGCSILLRQIKNIYQFLEDISDVKVFDDENPAQLADPLAVSCEYLFCKGETIPQDDLREFANRFWPDGIKIEN